MQDSEIKAGFTYEGVSATEALAKTLVNQLSTIRRCAIAIANDSPFTLVSPQSYLSSGIIVAQPDEIRPGYTGLIGCQKTSFSTRGCEGILSYNFKELPGDIRLHIMYSVPHSVMHFDYKINVCFGSEEPSEELFKEMYSGYEGKLVIPTGKPYKLTFKRGFVHVNMINEPSSVITIRVTTNDRS